MYEQWHPLGIVGIISAFNFPVAVWSWNAAIAWVCGDVYLEPSSKVPLCAVACQNIIASVLKANNVPEGVSCVLVGNHVGDRMNNDKRKMPLVSFHRLHAGWSSFPPPSRNARQVDPRIKRQQRHHRFPNTPT